MPGARETTGKDAGDMSWKGYPVEVTHRRGAAARIQILPGAVVRVTASSPDAVVPLLEEHAP
jgi:hypothetical protein